MSLNQNRIHYHIKVYLPKKRNLLNVNNVIRFMNL